MMEAKLSSQNIFADLSFPLRVNRLWQGTTEGTHSHDFVEMVYVARGGGRHAVAKNAEQKKTVKEELLSYPIMEGDIFVVAPGEAHAYAGNENLEIYNILFLPSLLQHDSVLLREIPDLFHFLVVEPCFRQETRFRGKLRLPLAVRLKVEACLDKISDELKRGEIGNKALTKGVFLELLVLIGRAYHSMVSCSDQSVDFQGKRAAIEKAIAYIEKKYSGSLSLDEISSQVYLSSRYFCTLFKETTGLSVWDYLTRIRLDQAKSLLRGTDLSITEIALAVGMGDSSYFAKVFKAREKMSPRAYRKL